MRRPPRPGPPRSHASLARLTHALPRRFCAEPPLSPRDSGAPRPRRRRRPWPHGGAADISFLFNQIPPECVCRFRKRNKNASHS
ncbi:hypothetical protein DF122_26320 [Burkholderia pseudomallei]|uniref:Uncharacterized protein n=1 Tax=Burkholderia pseudomallei 1710a TaxID=320371 RepID=A0A0E1W088_BURPE|nr:hypothetical protein BOC35_13450 [Burkholderia pseudomallei]EEP50847.1 conserved hypothetical protein [Burkholderia pseudomallei MSHR346]EET05726.1 hypothetical protein BURPS1710A_A0818 [Burkholderia pseudomallei 1710a]ARK57203.1 hypothetical protein BOC36_30275 [Burkholderia pseudomallei]ARK60529.1 hypothetical protein BOC37_11770 [Burkholderia pseudomallei]